MPTFLKLGDGVFATATHAGYSLVGPTYLDPGYSMPARPGETVVLWAVGLGLPTNTITAGSSTQQGSLPFPISCSVGDLPAPAAGYLVSPGQYQVNLTISADRSLYPGQAMPYVNCRYGDTLFVVATLAIEPESQSPIGVARGRIFHDDACDEQPRVRALQY